MSERRIRNNKIRRQRELRRHLLISIFTLCMTVTLALGIFSIQTSAKDSSEAIEIKYYTSITVSDGDTLWSLASEYKGNHYESSSAYIEEVMNINALTNETIYTGQHLIIPYYSAEFRN